MKVIQWSLNYNITLVVFYFYYFTTFALKTETNMFSLKRENVQTQY